MALPDAIFEYLSARIGTYISTAADKTALWLALALLFIVIYFVVIWFTDVGKSTAIFLSFMPVLVLDWLFSFGTYIFKFPFGYSYATHNFVITLNIVDWIFNFGIFKSIGLDAFNQVSGAFVLTGAQKALVFLLVSADSIIEFIVLAYIFYSIFDRIDIAICGAAIPTILYSIFISNPLKEVVKAEVTVKHVLYFFDHATPEQNVIVFGSLFISFGLIVFLISAVTSLIEGIGKTTVRPGLEGHQYEVSLTGLAFGLSLAYSLAVVLHPDYSWYTVLPVLIIYNAIRSGMKGVAKNRRTQKQQKELVREVVDEYRR